MEFFRLHFGTGKSWSARRRQQRGAAVIEWNDCTSILLIVSMYVTGNTYQLETLYT